jgi:hypothetical protein
VPALDAPPLDVAVDQAVNVTVCRAPASVGEPSSAIETGIASPAIATNVNAIEMGIESRIERIHASTYAHGWGP